MFKSKIAFISFTNKITIDFNNSKLKFSFNTKIGFNNINVNLVQQLKTEIDFNKFVLAVKIWNWFLHFNYKIGSTVQNLKQPKELKIKSIVNRFNLNFILTIQAQGSTITFYQACLLWHVEINFVVHKINLFQFFKQTIKRKCWIWCYWHSAQCPFKIGNVIW